MNVAVQNESVMELVNLINQGVHRLAGEFADVDDVQEALELAGYKKGFAGRNSDLWYRNLGEMVSELQAITPDGNILTVVVTGVNPMVEGVAITPLLDGLNMVTAFDGPFVAVPLPYFKVLEYMAHRRKQTEGICCSCKYLKGCMNGEEGVCTRVLEWSGTIIERAEGGE